jgi:hypothetical protein
MSFLQAKRPERPNQHRSTEPFSRSGSKSNQSYQKTQCKDQPQQNCNSLLQIHRTRETKRTAPEDFDTVSIFQQRNRKLKTASESTKPFKPSLKTAFEMNQIIAFINLNSWRAMENRMPQA